MKIISILSIVLLCDGSALFLSGDRQSLALPPFEVAQREQYTTKELVGYLSLDSVNWHWENCYEQSIGDDIRDELVRRRDVETMLSMVEHPTDEYQRRMIVESLYEIDDPRIQRYFERCASADITWPMYLCQNYLAERGDVDALKTLNDNYFKYPTSSAQWACTVALFGKFNYQPAIPNIIETIDAASLDLASASIESLKQFYPKEKYPDMAPAEEWQEYFRGLQARGHGGRLSLNAE